MNILDINDNNSLQNAALVLKKGGVLIFPTDTVYGIGCLMIDEAIEKLYKIKNRAKDKPTALLMNRNIFDGKRVEELVLALDKDADFMAGRLTIVDKIENYAIDFPESIISADKKIGIRLPHHEWLEKLINEVGPIVAASANREGDPAPTQFSEIDLELIKKSDLTIKTEEQLGQKASTVYDIEKKSIIRA